MLSVETLGEAFLQFKLLRPLLNSLAVITTLWGQI